MIIPHTELTPETLRALIEDFVTRDGTDYGENEVTLETKVSQVLDQLKHKQVFIVYSEVHETCDIRTKESLFER